MSEQLSLEVVEDMAVAVEPLRGRRSTGDAPELAAASPRALGAYYTPSEAALYIARWSLRSRRDRVVEPSMGDGVFLQAVRAAASGRGADDLELWGVELARDTYEATLRRGLIDPKRAILSDFLAVKPFPADVVIGNPPYVRLRHLPKEEAALALVVAKQVLGRPMDPSGSVWMPFVLHASRFLTNGGRLALVLPHELTHVRYARPLWSYLADNFGAVRVVRVFERVFPDILQDVVLLLADQKGERTNTTQFEVYERAEDLARERPAIAEAIRIDHVVRGERPFLEALLSRDLRVALREELIPRTVEARQAVSFNIGYVTGDRDFFHPSTDAIRHYELPRRSLRPTIASGRMLRGLGVRTSRSHASERTRLFLPPSDVARLTAGEQRYLRFGLVKGVHRRYKCRIRDPWFVTPGVRVPDLIVPVFADRPVVVINDAALLASNSLLCGYMRDGTAASFAAAWFTSLTLLELELRVHALGGGVMVLVPQEAANVRIPLRPAVDVAHLDRLDSLLAHGAVDDAFVAGDETVLRRMSGMTDEFISLIRDGAEVLRSWRAKRRLSQDEPDHMSNVLFRVS